MKHRLGIHHKQSRTTRIKPIDVLIFCPRCPESLSPEVDKPNKLKLASGDKTGNIIIWNVLDAGIAITLQVKQILDMKWHPKDPNILVSLHAPSSLLLWNVITDPLAWFEFNPFDLSHVSLASPGGLVYFITDFKSDSKPVQIEAKYTITSNKGGTKPASPNDFQQMVFSPHTRNIIYFVLSREIIVFDVNINQAVGSIVLDRSRTAFSQLMLLREEPNLLLCLHEDGSMSAWKKRKAEYKFDMECFSDIIRFNKQSRKKGTSILSVANSPLQERKLSTIGSDGAVYSYSLMHLTLSSWIWDYMNNDLPSVSGATEAKFFISGLVESISSAISSLSVSPFPSETESLIALGTYNGTVQIVDMVKNVTKSEYLLWPQAVRGVRWFSPTSVIAFYCEETSTKNEFKNRVTILDLNTGKQQEIRKVNGIESTFIRAIRISSARQYFVLLLKDRPFELWDMKTLTLLRTMKPFSQITSLEWSPIKNEQITLAATAHDNPLKEQFVFALPDGSLRFFSVTNGTVQAAEVHADLGMGIISSLAWKDDLLVSGDTAGSLHCWNFTTRKSQVFATNKGLIRRIRFSPAQGHQIIVLFNEGDFGIWDLDHGIRVSVSSYLKGRDLKAIDVDWITDTAPIIATTDGCIRVLDRSLSMSNSPFNFSLFTPPIYSPYLLPTVQSLNLKVLLQHYVSQNSLRYDQEKGTANRSDLALLQYIDPNLLASLEASTSIAQKCRITAQYFGNEDEIRFWVVAEWALSRFASDPSKLPPKELPETRKEEPNVTVQTLPSGTTITAASSSLSLPLYFDLVLESDVIRSMELERAAIQESRKSGYELTKKIADFNLLLGQREKSIELLLSTPTDHQHFYKDALKAAIISASISPDSFKNTMKWISTHLIASGSIDEGVQMLCLIGKSFDACRYLQSYDRWTDAAWLAKIALPDAECAEILRRWADYLNATNQKMKAAHILVSLGDFQKVLQILYDTGLFDMAALFAEACEERALLFESTPEATPASPTPTPVNQLPLLQNIRTAFNTFLQKIGNTQAAEFYATSTSLK